MTDDQTRSGAVRRYLADRFEWAAPGDQQEDAWLVRFCDKDCAEAIFTGPDAEREAWEHWNRYAPAFNIYVFRLAHLATPSPDAQRTGASDAEAMREACAKVADEAAADMKAFADANRPGLAQTIHAQKQGTAERIAAAIRALPLAAATAAPIALEGEALSEARARLIEMARKGWYVPGQNYPVLSVAADEWIKEVRRLIPLAFARAAAQPQVPEGYVLVPREPTEAMQRSGAEAWLGAPIGMTSEWAEYMRRTWSAMLSAAPTPGGA